MEGTGSKAGSSSVKIYGLKKLTDISDPDPDTEHLCTECL
jgi:hypothetical protein